MEVFMRNGYKKHQTIKAFYISNKPNNKNINNKNKEKIVVNVNLTYIFGITDKITSILMKNNISSTFKPMNTILATSNLL